MVLIVHNESVISTWFRLHINEVYLAPRIHVMWKDWKYNKSPFGCLFLQLTLLWKCQVNVSHLSSNVAILLFPVQLPWLKERNKNLERNRQRECFFESQNMSFTSCPSVSYVDMCCFQDIKQLLRLAVITNVWIIIFAWSTFNKFLRITDLHDIVSFKTPAIFRSPWLVILSQYLSFLNFP